MKTEDRGRGLDVIELTSMPHSATEVGFEVLDSHPELEANHRVGAEMQRLGGYIRKRYRTYGKSLRIGNCLSSDVSPG